MTDTKKVVALDKMEPGEEVRFRTANNSYLLTLVGGDEWAISGNPTFCPNPTPCKVLGSMLGDGALWEGRLAVGSGLLVEMERLGFRTGNVTEIE